MAAHRSHLSDGDHLYLIDGSAYIFRAYHALPPLTRKSDGLPVGAVSGFCNMLFKLLEDTKQGDKPSHLAVIFDASGHSFRNDLYPEYKANRPEAPEDLKPQFGLIRDAVRAFNVPCIELEGFEADDLIATYSEHAASDGAFVTIVSSDKDLMQLVGPRVTMLDPMKDRRIDAGGVVEKFGVGPEKVVDVQSLAGDSTDNVPGVPGIGIKTAAELINNFGDLDSLLKQADSIKQPKRRQNLIEFADQARISRDLVRLKQNVPVETPVSDFEVRDIEAPKLLAFLRGMEFSTLTKRIAAAHGIEDLGTIEPAELARTNDADQPGRNTLPQTHLSPGAVLDREALLVPIDTNAYETVDTLDALRRWVGLAEDAGVVAIDTETTSLNSMSARLCGISLAVKAGQACYIPIGHGGGDELDLSGAGVPNQLALEEVRDLLGPMLRSRSVLKVGHNFKYDLNVLVRHGFEIDSVDDTMLISYVQSAGLHGQGMDELSQIHLNHKPIAFSEMVGKGKSQKTFDQVPISEATKYAAEDADITLRFHRLLKPRLSVVRGQTVYETLDRPLVSVLANMEQNGVKVDVALLNRLSGDFAQRMVGLEDEAHALAGEAFNLGSPKQISEILFGKLSLPGGKKTKTGAFTTNADTMEELAAAGHDLPRVILNWRQLSKLKSTYTDALPTFVNPTTGRVHTSYSMASTTTGRLASTEPNLQNIPTRTKEGREIRTAFVAESDSVLISADYSQVELRLFAHIAGIDALKTAFKNKLDIHKMTASEMFGVPMENMDAQTRSRAKAINFGIIYGISAYGLSNQLGIPRDQASAYIKTYFERFPGIKEYMDRTKAFAKSNGYVETLFGRRCHMREINSKVPGLRGGAERAAINAPIQGTAADIIRRAMIRIPHAFSRAGLSAKMLLQIHDELIFECPKAEAEETCKVVSKMMERACEPVVELDVDLVVDACAAENWADAH